MFPTYRLDNPSTDESRILDHWSYTWASLIGPAYVLFKGFPLMAGLMLLLSALIGIGAFVGVGISLFVVSDSVLNAATVIVACVAAIILQGIAAVRLVRMGYLRSGWREGY